MTKKLSPRDKELRAQARSEAKLHHQREQELIRALRKCQRDVALALSFHSRAHVQMPRDFIPR